MMQDMPRPVDQHQASQAITVLLTLLDREAGYERARDVVDGLPQGCSLDMGFLHRVLSSCSPMSRPMLMWAIQFYREWSWLSLSHVDDDGQASVG